ncbi:MAG: glycosyltransferase [Candidatus Peribacteraceae bacterium]|nr:glycosyltransferase [Candidatus Peribacteraceae bacterium]
MIPLRLRGYRILLLTDTLVGMTWWGRTLLFRLCSRLYAWTLGWLIMLCAQKIIFFHPQPERLLKTLGVWKKSQVIPTGIDPAPYHHAPVPSPSPSPVPITITYVGRLESVKGVDDFLAAAAPLKNQFPNVTIQVVGWYKENHPLVAQYQDRVTFTGLRKDIPEILSKTDIFVLPSYSEGLSNALMEAMASSCACVATDVGGNAYLLQNGVSGFLFPVGDREALQSHLRRLIEDPAKRKMMGDAARKRIEEWFSWDVVSKMYRTLFAS